MGDEGHEERIQLPSHPTVFWGSFSVGMVAVLIVAQLTKNPWLGAVAFLVPFLSIPLFVFLRDGARAVRKFDDEIGGG